MDSYEQYLENKCDSQEYEIEKLYQELGESRYLATQRNVELLKLKDEKLELEARVAELEKGIKKFVIPGCDYPDYSPYACTVSDLFRSLLDRQPAQSLDRLRAQVLRGAADHVDEFAYVDNASDWMRREADRLEQGEG